MTDAGAGPLFPPQRLTQEEAEEEIQHLAQRDPHACGCEQTRWTLAALQQQVSWMNGLTIPGVHTILGRLRITWKRARSAVRSPDPNYMGKLADVNQILALARASAGRIAALYLDEVTVERQPTLGRRICPSGS